MASVDSLINTAIAGQDSKLQLFDANGVKYEIEADSTTGRLSIARNGTVISRFGPGGSSYTIVEAKTADYTVTAADSGKVFTTLGAAGAVNFTLPAVADGAGCEWRFMAAVAQNMVITAPADKLVTFNDAAATSLTFSQSGEIIGTGVTIVGDGSFYYAFVHLAKEAVTHTVA